MKKILVIAEDTKEKLLYLNSLKVEGFFTINAEDGVSGIEQARKHLPDLIICDPVVSQLDGYSLLAMLRQDLATMTIPFIFIGTKVTRAEVRKGMELGADDYLVKPFKLEELFKVIVVRIEKQEKLKQCYKQSLEKVDSEAVKSENDEQFFPSCSKLTQVFDFIEANYNQAITLNDVAKAVGYSKAYLTDLVKRQTGETVQQWIIKRRMEAARLLLLNTDQSAHQIAEAVGYNDKNYFFYQFRQHYTLTPQKWRQRQRIASKKRNKF